MRRYASYTAAFKLKVIEYACDGIQEEHGNCGTSRHFSINEYNVRIWRQQHEELKATKKTRQAFRSPKMGNFPQIETPLGLELGAQVGLEIELGVGLGVEAPLGLCGGTTCRWVRCIHGA